MVCVLRMPGEIYNWLVDFRATNPAAAQLVGESLIALMSAGASLGPPMVIPLADTTPQLDPREALDRSYQYRLEQVQLVRRSLADAAALASDIERQIAELVSAHPRLGDHSERAGQGARQEPAGEEQRELDAAKDQVAELRRILPGVVEAERKLTERTQRLQAEIDSFRTRKEILTARYTAAESVRAIHQVLAAAAADAGSQSRQEADRDEASETVADLPQITREIERELLAEPSAEGPGALPVQPGLMELRAGTPGNAEVRVLFAFQPPGTVLLIAVLEGSDAVQGHHREAVLLSSEVLRRTRAGQAAETGQRAFDDTNSFLDEFFPGCADEVEAGAAARVAANRARTLAKQRAHLGLTQAQVAERMGVRQERVSAIERAEPGATEVRTLIAYIEALGGRLEIIAEFGGERVVLH